MKILIQQVSIILLFYFGWVSFLFPEQVQGNAEKELSPLKRVITQKRVPFKTIESFLKEEMGEKVQIIEGKDVLVPADFKIIFNLNKKEEKILVQGFALDGSLHIYQEFSFQRLNSTKIIPDVSLGNSLSIILNQQSISIQLIGRALESGSIGDIIRVRAANLARRFRVRIVSKKEGLILF